MNCIDCCSLPACDCCSLPACDSCCSLPACDSDCCDCCVDCGGGLSNWLVDWLENWLENNVTLKGDDYVLPPATTSTLGGVIVGDGLSVEPNGRLSNAYTLPTASKTTKGGIKVGHSLRMDDEVMNVALDTVPSTVEGFMWINSVST